MRREIIQSDESKLEVVITGEGDEHPWVILIPDLGRGAADFADLAAALTEAGWRTASIDQRGVGSSEGNLDGLTLRDLGEDLAEVIGQLAAAPAAVVAHGFGTRVARWLAADQRELFRCAVLLAPEGREAMSAEASEAFAKLAADLPDEQRRSLLKKMFFAEASDPTPWVRGFWPAAARAQLQAAASSPSETWWSGGEEVRFLIVQGKEDRYTPPANGHLLKEELASRGTLLDIDGAAHELVHEQPQVVAEVLVEYLRDYYYVD